MTTPMLKIDGYAHVSPPRYTEALRTEFPGFHKQILGITPPLYDMEARFKVMDAFAPLAQVLTIGPVPPWSTLPSRGGRWNWPAWPTTRWPS
jgi:hypothetical protein